MRDNLGQDRLSLVFKRFVRRGVTVSGEFEWFGQLPFEIDSEADWNLVSCEARV
jgi:hypothetical protein